MNAAQIGDGKVSQSGIFFLPQERRVAAVGGVSLPVLVELAGDRRLGSGPIARRVTGAKWTFRKGPFFSREQRR